MAYLTKTETKLLKHLETHKGVHPTGTREINAILSLPKKGRVKHVGDAVWHRS